MDKSAGLNALQGEDAEFKSDEEKELNDEEILDQEL